MFDMGFLEILVVGAIALLVIGPDKLPSVARKVGFWVGKTQRFVAGVKSDIASELQADELRNMLTSQEDQIKELKSMVNDAKSDFQRSTKDAQKALNDTISDTVADVKATPEILNENNEKMQKIARDAGYDIYDEDPDAPGDDASTTASSATSSDRDSAKDSANRTDDDHDDDRG